MNDSLRVLVDRLLALHSPTYTVNGTTYTNRVLLSEEDMSPSLRLRHQCVTGNELDACVPGEEHYVEACSECRQVCEDVDGYLLWPCPTVEAVHAAQREGSGIGETR